MHAHLHLYTHLHLQAPCLNTHPLPANPPPTPPGDYNTSPDRHLGPAQLDRGLRPALLVSEATYATTLRESKKARERDLLGEVRGRRRRRCGQLACAFHGMPWRVSWDADPGVG